MLNRGPRFIGCGPVVEFERRVQAIIVNTNGYRLQVVKRIKYSTGDGNRIRERGKNPTVSNTTCQGDVEIVASGATYL